MTLEQFIALNEEIAALVRSGVLLDRGLAALGDDMPGRLGKAATAVAEQTSRGEPLDRAILDQTVDLPPAYRAVVHAGLRAGRLPAALEAVAGSARRLTDTYRAAVVAVAYPLMI
ncbi:MAG: type II secretion system F family protein, partial [Pirellulales bacterium]|nr:type II secretion system F family protein [Pirellulales bacterium]